MEIKTIKDLQAAFFGAIFGSAELGKNASIGISVNDLAEKRWKTAWFTSAEDAARHCSELSNATQKNIYYHTCLHDPSSLAGNQFARGRASTATMATALWIDIDIAGAGHSKPNLVSSREGLEEVLSRLTCQPSVRVRTVGGLHLYWILREPVELQDAEQAEQMQRIHKNLERLLRDLGAPPDATADFARVFRVPGCLDNKLERKKRIELETPLETLRNPRELKKYNLSDIEEMISTLGFIGKDIPRDALAKSEYKPSAEQIRTAANGLVFDMNAQPSADMRSWIDLQCAVDAKFNATWIKRRTDLADQSQSGYDMSLCAMLVRRKDCAEQELINTLIYYRRLRDPNGRTDKFTPGYYIPLILRAKSSLKKETDKEQAETAKLVTEDLLSKSRAGERVEAAQILQHLQSLLGLPEFQGIIKQLSDPHSIYKIRLGGETFTLGEVESIVSFARFKSRIADICGVIIRSNPRTWDDNAQLLLNPAFIEIEDLGEESNPNERVSAWVFDFVSSRVGAERPILSFEEFADKDRGHEREPFLKDGFVHISADELYSFLRLKNKIDVDRKRFYSMLKTAGLIPKVFNLSKGKTTARIWIIPQNVYRYSAPVRLDWAALEGGNFG